MTGGAGTYSATVMVQVNIILQQEFQKALSRLHIGKGNWLQSLLLKFNFYRIHLVVFVIGPARRTSSSIEALCPTKL